MAAPGRESDNATRLLVLLNVLVNETTPTNPLTMASILSMVEEKGVHMTRKTAYQHIKSMGESGIHIARAASGKNGVRYWYESGWI